MPDVETKLKISADQRELQKVAQTIGKTFDPQAIKGFERASKDYQRTLVALTREQAKLNKQMAGVASGSAAYKELATQLKDVQRQTRGAEMGLARVGQVLERNANRQRALNQQAQAQQQRQVGARAFAGGLAQGLGVADYMPRAGLAGRVGGAMLGGGIRRGMGAIAAPFQAPGVGGFAQAISALPFGGLVAGPMQAAAGYYQQAVGFDRAKRESIFFSRQENDAERVARIGAAQIKGDRLIADAQARAGRMKPIYWGGRYQRPTGVAAPPPEGGGYDAGQALREREAFKNDRKAAHGRERRESADFFRYRQGVEQKELEGRRRAAINRAKRSAGRMMAQAKNEMGGLPPADVGVAFGIEPGQAQQMAQGFFRARGGIFTRGGQREMVEMMAAQTRFGIAPEMAGQFARMGMAGGGGQLNMNMATVLQTAVMQGLRGSQVSEYLQQLVTLGQQAEKTGVKINVREFAQATGVLRQVGFQGLQAQRVAGGMTQAAMGLSQRGVSSPVDMLMLRAAGYDPSQGAEGYARAMNKIEGGMSSGMMQDLLGQLTSGVQAGGFGSEMQALMFRRVMNKMGSPIGAGQASSIIEAYKSGKTPSTDDLVATDFRKQMIKDAKARAGGYAPTAVSAAGLQAFQIGIGKAAAAWVVPMEKAGADIASVANKFSSELKNMAKLVSEGAQLMKAGIDKFREMAKKGLTWKQIFDALTGL